MIKSADGEHFAWWSAIVALAILAGTFLFNVAPYWEVNPQYSFGWLVPLLGGFLFWRRWPSRPAPTPAQWSPARWLLVAVAAVFFPIWLIVQPNPDWRLATWALATQWVVMALLALYFRGGRAWVVHFAFPVLFLCTAVPWPFGLEFPLVQGLMRTVAAVTVELLPWFDIAAVQHGNLIEVRSGTLGVDEACSGIRSLQGTLMASLFLGEFYWFSARKRLLLVVAGVVLAFVCNVGRAFLIAYVAARDGIEAVAHWHDPAGYTILTLCLIGVAALALLLGPGVPPAASTDTEKQAHALPGGLFAGVAVWLIVSMVATEAWYRLHEGGEKIRWSLRWPETRKGFTDFPVPEAARDLLLYDEGRTATWEQPDGARWSVFFFRWNSGSSRSRVVPRSHRPEICLPASGFTMEDDFGTRVLRVKGIDMPFHSYRFRKAGQDVSVFSCLWQDHARDVQSRAMPVEWSRWVGLSFVLSGERNLSQQVMQVAMAGYDSPATAEAALRTQLEEMIVP